MHQLSHLDKKQHGTQQFPVEYYYVDRRHPHYQMPSHWHNEWELLLVREGQFQIHIDEASFTACAGDILLLRGGALHGGVPSDCVYECLVFDLYGLFRGMELIKKDLRPFYRQTLLPHLFFSKEEHPAIAGETERLMNTFRTASDHRELQTIACLTRIFSDILEQKFYAVSQGALPSDSPHIEQIKTVLDYIESNFSSQLTLADMAKKLNLNANYFCRIFRSLLHQSPMDYVNFYRIEQASYLLESTDLPITLIGAECGFSESSYFTKVFKKYKGVSPRQYRKSI